MKTLYLECSMGAAGDMLTAALLELADRERFLRKMRSLALPGTEISACTVTKCGITGTQMRVRVNGTEEESLDAHTHVHVHEGEHSHGHEQESGCEHLHGHEREQGTGHEHLHEYKHEQENGHMHVHEFENESENEHGCEHKHGHEHTHHAHVYGHHTHTSLQEIENLIHGLDVSDQVKQDAAAVYRLIAEAEGHAHGRTVEEIHFHEVGTLDAVADVVGVCLLMEEIAPERVVVSPVHVGSGHVHCAHGILPVPAPATAWLLEGIPIYGGQIEGELCTPTGAALLKHFADAFGDMPVMCAEKIGYGFGKKEFSRMNCVRAFLGNTLDQAEKILELKCNLDDMTPEHIGFAMEMLLEAGALDVFTSPVGMKKNRPGVLLTVLCRPEQRERMLRELFTHTSTIGVRETVCDRFVLQRRETVRHTEYGDIQFKQAEGYGVSKSKPEYEDIARIAREQHVSLEEILEKFQ